MCGHPIVFIREGRVWTDFVTPSPNREYALLLVSYGGGLGFSREFPVRCRVSVTEDKLVVMEDARHTREVYHLIGRRPVDYRSLTVHVAHGVCTVRGSVRKLESHPEADLAHECEVMRRTIRSVRGLRDVVWEATMVKTAH